MKKTLTLLLLLGSFPLWAEPSPSPTPDPMFHMPKQGRKALEAPRKTLKDYQKAVGLSDEQMKKVEDLVKTNQSKILEAQMKARVLTKTFQDLSHQQAPLSVIRKAAQDLGQARAEARILDLRAARGLHDLLTPAQWEKWMAVRRKDAQR